MSIWIALILGIVQGLCEFLPISSSGHLVLLQQVFGIDNGALFFTIMLHLGTLIAVFVIYRRQIWEIVKSMCRFIALLFTLRFNELGKHLKTPTQRKIIMLMLATLVTTVLALIFKDVIDESYEGKYLGFGFIATALILFAMNFIHAKKQTIAKMRVPAALGIGLMQGVAILPGISRSGSTIAGATFFGLRKDEAAEFSFLLSIPAILGSLVFEIPDVAKTGLSNIPWIPVLVGVIAAAVSGFLAIKLMIRLIVNKSLNVFAIYTAVLGIAVLLDQLVFNVVLSNPFTTPIA